MTVQGRLREDETQAEGEGARAGTGESTGIGMRIGFTLTKRVGNAVQRNRIKRRLRAAVRQLGADGADATARPKDAEAPPAPISPAAAGQTEGAEPGSGVAQNEWPSVTADIVVIGRWPAISAPFEALVADLARALPKVTKPGVPAKRGRGRDAQMRSTHRRRGRGEGGAKPGPSPSRNS